ncbi:MAG: phosphoserine aminotransferase [Acidimicrobiaceae bacterium]|nr:phosphoserine aminotransferase [Acidimicrobiaceae bacterium]
MLSHVPDQPVQHSGASSSRDGDAGAPSPGVRVPVRVPGSAPDITIPLSLLPSDGRFGSGPSKVRPDAVDALAAVARSYMGTSHRQAGVRSIVGRLRAGLRSLFSLPDDYEIVLGNGGTTVFWDAAVFGLIERKSQHLSFGEFSSKFASAVAAAPHLDAPDVIDAPPGTHPLPAAREGVDVYALTHNETSTGVMMDVRRPDGAAPESLVAVDATSGAGGLRVDPEEFDCYYFAPQKCFGADGGLWVALCSPAAVERIERISASDRWIPASIDLKTALDNSRLDQTYNTPALATLFLLATQVDWMLEGGGLEFAAGRCDHSAENLYGWAEASSYATPFVAKPDERSRVVGTIDLDPAVDAGTVCQVLRANGVVDTDSYRKLGRNQLRIAMFPAIEPEDIIALTRCIDFVADALS